MSDVPEMTIQRRPHDDEDTAVPLVHRVARRALPARRLVGWTVLYAVAIAAGQASRGEQSDLSLVWPAAGVAVVWLLGAGAPRARGVALTAMVVVVLLANVLLGREPAPSLLMGLVNALHAVVGVGLLRLGGWRSARPAADGRDVLVLVGASVGAALAGALPASLVAARFFDVPVPHGLPLVFVRNTVSTFVLVAVLLALPALADRRSRLAGTATGPERVATIVTTLVLSWLVTRYDGASVGFLLLPATVWVAVRCGTSATAAVVGLQSAIVVVSTVSGHGPFAGSASAVEQALVAQAFIAVLVLVGLCLSLAEQERDRALESSRADHAQLLAHLDAALIAHATLVVEPSAVRVIAGNTALTRLLGVDASQVRGLDWLALVDDAHRQQVREVVQDLAQGRASGWSGELVLFGADGPVWVQAALGVSAGATTSGEQVRITAQLLDITARKRAEARLEQLALHDDLTGLPNRVLWRERLLQHLATAREHREPVGVLYLDLDGFKAVNDTYGHAAGDALLVEVAERLRASARPGDTVARIGGDEFLVACADVADGAALEALARRIVQALSAEVLLGDRRLSVTVSIGGVLSDGDQDVDALVRRADRALYRAKDQGRGRAEVLPVAYGR